MTTAIETHRIEKAEIIAAIIKDAQDAIELATGEKVVLKPASAFTKKSMEQISEVVCRIFNVTLVHLQSHSRLRPVVDARKAFTMLFFLFNSRNPAAAGLWLKRDRSSVYYYIEDGYNLLATDGGFEEKYLICRDQIELINPEK